MAATARSTNEFTATGFEIGSSTPPRCTVWTGPSGCSGSENVDCPTVYDPNGIGPDGKTDPRCIRTSPCPPPEQIAATNVARLARSLDCETYDELHAVSVDEPDRFWHAVVDDLGLPLARPWDQVLDESRGIEWATWFLGARLNIAEACVHRWARETPDLEAAKAAARTLGIADSLPALGDALRETTPGFPLSSPTSLKPSKGALQCPSIAFTIPQRLLSQRDIPM